MLENNCIKKNQRSELKLFDDQRLEFNTIGDVCDIGNGLVSGLDKAFQIQEHSLNEYEKNALIDVVKAKDLKPFFAEKMTKYIFIDGGMEEADFRENYPNFYLHFQEYKVDLRKRYQYNRKINYWEWVFLRNINLFSKSEKRIFVPCKERISNKDYFRFALVDEGVFPTQDVTALFRKRDTKESIEYILAYLNNPRIFEWLKCNGIVKGNIVEFSEKPISSIPFRVIDWSNPNEVELHAAITEKTKVYVKDKHAGLLTEINHLLNDLLKC